MRSASKSLTKAVREAAIKALGGSVIQDVRLKNDNGFLGEEILRIRLVLPPNGVKEVGGEKLFDALDDISRVVKKSGESRRVVLEFADLAELEELGSH